jgi:SOS regulatory protein LexA
MARVTNYLTRRQQQILEFIEDFHSRKGLTPTHREICEQFGYSSYGTVHKHLKLLQQKGFLRRDWNQKRGLEIVRSPRSAGVDDNPLREVPFFGRIAAGRPIEAISGEERLTVPPSLMRGGVGDHYVLQVVGDSMIEEGIHDGDLVVVQSSEQADKGEMVVALIDGEEATLKRFFPEGKKVRLQPSHPTMKPLVYPGDSVQVQGIVVGLMRKF